MEGNEDHFLAALAEARENGDWMELQSFVRQKIDGADAAELELSNRSCSGVASSPAAPFIRPAFMTAALKTAGG